MDEQIPSMLNWSYEDIQTFSSLMLEADLYRKDSAALLGDTPTRAEAWDVKVQSALRHSLYNVSTCNVGVLKQMREAYVTTAGPQN